MWKAREVDDVLPLLLQVLPARLRGRSREDIDRLRMTLERQIVVQLLLLKEAMEQSSFFRTHEFVGASLLFIVDETNARVRMIDFAKTKLLPDGITINHTSKWEEGNHEDGALFG